MTISREIKSYKNFRLSFKYNPQSSEKGLDIDLRPITFLNVVDIYANVNILNI